MYDMGLKIKEMRTIRGLTQQELANRIGRSKVAVSSYETNQQVPPTEVLLSICQALHTPISYFVTYNCEDTYSAAGLSSQQKELMDLLYEEFVNSEVSANELSNRQIEIIKKLILIFTKK